MNMLRKAVGYNLFLKAPAKSRLSRRNRLADIITHANAKVPFYKGGFDNFLSSSSSLTDNEFLYAFSHLPVVSKSDLKFRNDDFMSETLRGKIDILASGKAPSAKDLLVHGVIKKNFFTSISTGGTSGVPTFRWLDYDDANIFAQSFLHSFKLNGWNPGESFVVFYPLKSYFTGAYAEQAKTLQRLFGFTMVPFETVTKETVINLLQTLYKNKATLLVIFPCVLQRVAEVMREESLPPFENLPCINVSGEFFMDCSKAFIQSMFPDSDIQSTYGAVEFGEIAHQKGANSFDYDVFDDYAYLEQGPNNSILVTSYRQHAFPLIRYKIEDMGRVVNNPDSSQSLKNLEGKNSDYLIGADGYMYYTSFFNTFVNELNRDFNKQIIHFMLRHSEEDGRKYMQLNFVLASPDKQDDIRKAALDAITQIFSNYDSIDVNFCTNFAHDYTRKFKIIGEGDGLAEVVGGYYQRKAS